MCACIYPVLRGSISFSRKPGRRRNLRRKSCRRVLDVVISTLSPHDLLFLLFTNPEVTLHRQLRRGSIFSVDVSPDYFDECLFGKPYTFVDTRIHITQLIHKSKCQ